MNDDDDILLRAAMDEIVAALERVMRKLMADPSDPGDVILNKLLDVHSILTSI